MNNFKQLLYYMIGRVPAELNKHSIKGKKLLHISDTPSAFFGELRRIIEVIKPEYIVHTGDLVDNIKLELFPGSIWRYERDVSKLIKLLELSDAEGIYIALGNHDNTSAVEKLCSRAHLLKEAATVNIAGIDIAISHYPDYILEMPAQCNLFGHDLTLKTGLNQGRLYLNGISSINLIDLETKNYYCYPYPAGTNDERLGRGKIGL